MNKSVVDIRDLVGYCDQLLTVSDVVDYCPNGLQIEASNRVEKLVVGVSACERLIDQAIQQNADAILVHHGYFWKGENPCISGIKGRRIRKLIENGISLIAYHLPLDLHAQFGNNVLWGQLMGMSGEPTQEEPLMYQFTPRLPMSPKQLCTTISDTLNREPLHISSDSDLIKKIAWCSGGGQDFIEVAKQVGADAFLSGEISERTTHLARELGVHYFACGHHASEIFGVRALGDHLSQKFDIDCTFVDIFNPV